MQRKNKDGKITVAVAVFLAASVVLYIILALIGAAIFGLVYVADAFGLPRWTLPVCVAAVALVFALCAADGKNLDEQDPDELDADVDGVEEW